MMKDFIKVTGSENGKPMFVRASTVRFVDTVTSKNGEVVRAEIDNGDSKIRCTETPEEIAALIESAQEETPTSGNIVINAPIGYSGPEMPKPITNYEKLFGTPERAAKTMEARCDRSCVCDMCACRDAVCTTHNDCIEGVTKWLNKEVSNG
jgi:hypothetical protein